MNPLDKTLEQMSYQFSSNEFCKRARKNGITEREIHAGVVSTYLQRNAIQSETRRMWQKYGTRTTSYTQVPLTNTVAPTEKSMSDKITEAIQLLKSNGYKIMKPTTDWIEI
jgi:hypothetical protein